MTAKKTSFDLMNLGYPVHSDPYEIDRTSSSSSQKEPSETVMSFKELKEKLHKEAKNVMPDFFPRDPSSTSEDSEDFEFPETVKERARRLSFVRRRKLHYNEFATVELARRLIHEEFNTSSESVHSEDHDYLAEVVEEECAPCEADSDESYPYIQYDRTTTTHSQVSDESIPKEDPEPGFHPTHHCYDKLMNETAEQPADVPKESVPVEEVKASTPPLPEVVKEIDLEVELPPKTSHHSQEKHTRVIDRGEHIDLSGNNAVPKNTRLKTVKRPAERKSRNL
ncbi:uncharacterized protein LOC108033404 [Drosophila biarmipes]|uniref:uncharacterized protein LOC108033404 n=1 Tax=Drosophila biarmipes TaxID=125945 RepID=UPI0007E703E9|nr:uncharacterized protein LOC108033404 [Drosophila biarmipes]